MDIRQKFSDVWLLIKEERKYQFLLVGLVLLLAWGYMDSQGRRRTRRPQHSLKPVKTKVGDGKYEAYGDLVKRFSKDMSDMKQGQQELNVKLSENEERVAENEERTAEILKKVIERLADIERQPVGTTVVGKGDLAASGDGDFPSGDIDIPDDGLEAFGMTDVDEVAPPPPPREEDRRAIIGIGDTVRVRLLAGANAPTDGTPYPVLFRLVSEVHGPDGSALPLGEARLLAAAQGSLTDRRALFRLTSLNMRFPDGSRGIYPVDGWIVGEDGIRGMEGILVDPIGKALSGKFMAGFVGGVGDGVAASRQTMIVSGDSVFETLNGDVTEYALGKGLGKAGRAWEQFINKRTDLLVPHVKVMSGREATAVFSKNLQINGLIELLEEEEMVFASLD